MNQPPTPPPPPRDPNDVAMKQARLEIQMNEAKLEIIRSHRHQRESAVNRRFTFIVIFALSMGIAYIMDHKGYSPQMSVLGFLVVFCGVGGWWTFRKPY
jgi:hypothetical protein